MFFGDVNKSSYWIKENWRKTYTLYADDGFFYHTKIPVKKIVAFFRPKNRDQWVK